MNELIYRSRNQRISLKFSRAVPVALCALVLALAGLLFASLSLGSYDLSYAQVLHTLLQPQTETTATTIVFELRLPRFIAACLVGALLGLSGAILQTVTRNRLADPSLVGISQGASLAVVAMIVIWPTALLELRPVFAFVGAIVAASVVQWIATGKTSSASLRFILVGVGVSASISACTSAMLTYGQINQAAAALSWLAGSVHHVSWDECMVLLVGLLLLTPALLWSVRPLTGLQFGPELATGFGLGLRKERILVIALAVALAALAVSFTGPLGFIGLLAPQLVQRLLRSGIGAHLMLTALTAACLVAAADLLGRIGFAPLQLPAGLVVAVIGAPVFIGLIFKGARSKSL